MHVAYTKQDLYFLSFNLQQITNIGLVFSC